MPARRARTPTPPLRAANETRDAPVGDHPHVIHGGARLRRVNGVVWTKTAWAPRVCAPDVGLALTCPALSQQDACALADSRSRRRSAQAVAAKQRQQVRAIHVRRA